MRHASEFRLRFAPEVVEHLDAIERKHHRLIERILDERLRYTPERETRNRKRVEQPAPFGATWELRFGPGNCFRVFYEVDHAERTVWVLAIAVKKRDRLMIGGQEFEL